MLGETWKNVVGFEGYILSNQGRIYDTLNKRFISRSDNGHGYLTVQLNRGRLRGSAHRRVHVLVLEAFVGPRPIGFHACHNDGDKLNNCVWNLRWDSCKGNMRDKRKHGTTQDQTGEKNPVSKLTKEDVLEIRKLLNRGIYQRTIAAKFGISRTCVSAIRTGRNWSHV